MITIPTECFYVIKTSNEAANLVTSILSKHASKDIETVYLTSDNFSNDIAATVDFNETILAIKENLNDNKLFEESELNPLYIPSTREIIDEVLDGEIKSDFYNFTGMDGSPFTLKMTCINKDDKDIISGKVACLPFHLPSYTDIFLAQKTKLQ